MNMWDIPLRTATAADWPTISALLAQAFHQPTDAEAAQVEGSVFEPERAVLAEDGATVVGHAAAFSRDLTVPGALVPAAHVTMVGVLPTHRRRGLLTRMMHRQLHEVRDGGREPIAVLWASEGRIYGRFGYGLAAQKLEIVVPQREVTLPALPAGAAGRIRLVDPATSWKTFATVYEQQRPHRTGWSSRDERWWQYVLADPATRRAGGTELRAAVHESPDGTTGYALWRTKADGSVTGPAAQVLVREVVATEPEAYLSLWHFLVSIDLTRTTRFPFGAVDEPLLHLVNEPRALGPQLTESLYVRLVDLPAALAARRYATGVDIVLEVTDALLPANAGRWHLRGDPSGASCSPTTAPAHLACDVRELGAAYLGGVSLGALAGAGRVRELTGGSVAAAATAFGWHRLPAATEVF